MLKDSVSDCCCCLPVSVLPELSPQNVLGFNGVITIKIIKSTNKTSISGVTLIFGVAPPDELPVDIPILFNSYSE